MLIEQILLIAAVIILSRSLLNDTLYKWALFILSLIAIYWFQPLSPIRHLDFWLPTIVVFLSILGWSVLFNKSLIDTKENTLALIVILAYFVLLAGARFLRFNFLEIFVTLPGFVTAGIAVLLTCFFFIAPKFTKGSRKIIIFSIIGLILVIFIVLKTSEFSLLASRFLRQLNDQLVTLAKPNELAWVGYSYFSFRLLHTLIDRKRVRDLELSLREYLTYLVFFPAYIAGPIDRVEHFTGQLRASIPGFLQNDFLEGVFRITRGVFLKFILADSLAVFSLNTQSVNLIENTVWAWVVVYGYAFRILFDFAGYTDIAIGLGRLAGIQLPENFNRPYLSRNVTLFWNNWHITLTQWFRTYYFNPVTRLLRSKFCQLKPWVIILGTQLTTMLLIALWHGISWNFVFWGLWNGLGLFLHNRWSTLILPRNAGINNFLDSNIGTAVSVIFTFNFIALGWIWFALPTINDSMTIFQRLIGL